MTKGTPEFTPPGLDTEMKGEQQRRDRGGGAGRGDPRRPVPV